MEPGGWDSLRWGRRILATALVVVLALCALLARGGEDGGALVIAGYALLWYTLIRMFVLVPEASGSNVRGQRG
jgi:hypothetical protein